MPRSRSIALFVAGMLVAGVFALTPVGAGVRNGLKGIFRKADRRYESNKTIKPFGPIDMNVGDGQRTVMRIKPFTLWATCEIGEGDSLEARVVITTAVDDAALGAFSSNADFDVADNGNPEIWAENEGFPLGGGPDVSDNVSMVTAPNGRAYSGDTILRTNGPGAHCQISGNVTRVR